MKNRFSPSSKNQIKDSVINAGGNIHIGDIIDNVQSKDKRQNENSITTNFIDNLRKDIAKSKIKSVLENLLKVSASFDEDLQGQIIHQSQRWNDLKRKENNGTIRSNESEVICNRIVSALIDITKEIETTP